MGDKKFTNYNKVLTTVAEMNAAGMDVDGDKVAKVAQRSGTVKCLKLRLRSSACHDDDNTIAVLDEGQRVLILSEIDDWLKVHAGAYQGFVMKQFIKEE